MSGQKSLHLNDRITIPSTNLYRGSKIGASLCGTRNLLSIDREPWLDRRTSRREFLNCLLSQHKRKYGPHGPSVFHLQWVIWRVGRLDDSRWIKLHPRSAHIGKFGISSGCRKECRHLVGK